MNIIINGKHLEITPSIKDYTEGKIKKFSRFLPNISESIVTLSVEKHRHKVDVLLKADGKVLQAVSITDEIYSSIDDVIEKIERQIKKYREKVTSHRKGNKKQSLTIESFPPEKEGRTIQKERLLAKPISPDEAALQLDSLNKDFHVFINDQNGDVNVIYRRKDGHYGLIEPGK